MITKNSGRNQRNRALFFMFGLVAVSIALGAYAAILSRPARLKEVQLLKVATPDIPCSVDDKVDCYSGYYDRLVQNLGSQQALSDLATRYDSDPLVRERCHTFAHAIGRSAARKLGSVADAFAEGNSFCWAGYYHGVMEYLVAKVGKQNIVAQIKEICAPLAETRAYTMDHYNCVHGLGHGLMGIMYNDVPESLKGCDALGDSQENFVRTSCWTGVFMQNIISDQQGDSTPYLRRGDYYYPCNSIEEKYRTICYAIQTSYMLKVAKQDVAKVFEACGKLELSYRDVCYQGIGRDISGDTISDIKQTQKLCSLGENSDEQGNCFYGAARDFLAYYRDASKAESLCKSLPLDVQGKCFEGIRAYEPFFLW